MKWAMLALVYLTEDNYAGKAGFGVARDVGVVYVDPWGTLS